jgi:ribosomal-protein-alanine N-acetyltransferase
MPTRLETPRLIVRSFEPGDAEAWVVLVNDPEVTRFLPPTAPARMETFHERLEDRLAMEHDIGYTMWAVEDKAPRAFVGQCGLRPVDQGQGPEIDLAYHYARATWNKGYGTEAAVAVLSHGLGTLKLDAIMAVAMPENVGSWRIMQKAGMRYEGLVDYYGLNGLKKYVAERDWWISPEPPCG